MVSIHCINFACDSAKIFYVEMVRDAKFRFFHLISSVNHTTPNENTRVILKIMRVVEYLVNHDT